MNIKHKLYFANIFLLALFSGCNSENEKFTGYLVAKEYTPEHMSNETPEKVIYASVIVPRIVTPHVSKPHKVDAKYVWYIANKDIILSREVSYQMFNTRKCGDKITINRY